MAGDNRFVVRSEVAVDLALSESSTAPDGVFVGECMLAEAFGDDENAIVGVCGTGNGRMTPLNSRRTCIGCGGKASRPERPPTGWLERCGLKKRRRKMLFSSSQIVGSNSGMRQIYTDSGDLTCCNWKF